MPAVEKTYDFNASINTEVAAIPATAGLTHVVRSCVISLSAGGPGIVVFKDGTGGTVVASKLLQASAATVAPLVCGPETWGASGKRLTAGNGLTATLAGATLQGQFYCTDES